MSCSQNVWRCHRRLQFYLLFLREYSYDVGDIASQVYLVDAATSPKAKSSSDTELPNVPASKIDN